MTAIGIDWPTVQTALQRWVVAGTGIAADHVVWEGQIRGPRPTQPGISLGITGIALEGWDWLDTQDKILTVTPTTILGINTSNGNLTVASHQLVTGDGPILFQSSGVSPGGTTGHTNYWGIVVSPTVLRIATSFQRAMAGTALIPTDAGTGTISIIGTAATVRAGQEIQFIARGLRKATLTIQAYTDSGIGLAMPQAILSNLEARSGLPSMDAILDGANVAITDFGRIRVHHGQYNVAYFEPRAVVEVSLSLASEVYEDATVIERVIETDLNNITRVIPPDQT